MDLKQTEALKLALEALKGGLWDYGPEQDEHQRCNEVIAICEAALAEQPAQQLHCDDCGGFDPECPLEHPEQGCEFCSHSLYAGTKCKNCGKPAIKQDLTPEQLAQQQGLQDLWHKVWPDAGAFVRASADDLTQFAKAISTSPQPAQQQEQKLEFVSPGGGYVPAIPRPMPLDWKLVPRKATPEMLKAMDECAQEGYDERLYAGMASSVYMAAWDASPVMGTLPEQPAQQQEPDGRVISANCEYATVQWLHQTSNIGGGDPKNSRSWPIGGEDVYLSPPASKPWVSLTEKEHTEIAVQCGCMSADWVFYGAAVERILKEKNS